MGHWLLWLLICCRAGGMMQAKFPRVWGNSPTSMSWVFPTISCQVAKRHSLIGVIVALLRFYATIIFKTKLLAVLHTCWCNADTMLWMDHCGGCTAALRWSWWWHNAGEIPASLGQLTKLQWLNLSENQLSGNRHSLLAVVGGILCCFGFYDVIIFEIELLAFARIWSFNVELSCGWDTVVVALLRCFDDGLMQAKFLQVWGSSPTSKGWIFGATNWVVKSHPSFLWLFSACTHLLCCLSVIILSNFFFSIHLLILISLFYLCCWRTHSLWFRLIACYCGWLSFVVKLYSADL